DNTKAAQEETSKIDRLLAAREIDRAEYEQRVEAIVKKYGVRRERSGRARLADAESSVRFVNMIVPLGWVPYGAVTSLEGRIGPSMLATLGLALIGAASLRRSYGTTMRLYTGQFSSRKPSTVTREVRRENKVPPSAAFLEKHIPWISEHASAITLACFLSLT